MITSLKIDGYRGFSRFQIDGLGRVNLFVGRNNSGKTSVLEALYLLTSQGDPSALNQIMSRRGERSLPDRSIQGEPELEVRHLFNGHELIEGLRLVISAVNQTSERSMSVSIVQWSEHNGTVHGSTDFDDNFRLAFLIEATGQKEREILLSEGDGIPSRRYETPRGPKRPAFSGGPSQFIAPQSLDSSELIYMWVSVALGPNQDLVLQALRFLDPNIEGIAGQASSIFSSGTRGGFIVKRLGQEQPIPIGSLGEGMWRILAMAIAITQCKGGVLIVDEIDTGLHYTVMSSMWKLVYEAAKEFDVQVFASTHSYDCVYSLADVCRSGGDAKESDIVLHRIDSRKSSSVRFAEDEIKIAAERNIELR